MTALLTGLETANQILTRYWGFSKFKPVQEDVIKSVLAGKDTLALMPTGGGKSICYQVPALAMEGLCVVISPLIALMKDQVEFLKRKGIAATMIHSFMTGREIDFTLDNCIYGTIKLLYISPERMGTELFRLRVQKMKINLIAVDEAHCISQWGYDFRPSYLKITDLREFFPFVPILALTASATPDVVEDMQHHLRFKEKNVMRASFERRNLAYMVLHEEDKLSRLLKIVNNVQGSGLIYVRTRKKAEEIAQFLKQKNIKCDFYHAGIPGEERNRKQDAWLYNRIRVMVCTNAFGLGINKADVRFVVHIDLPDSLESYYQEAGRAGRDNKKAYSVLLYSNSDRLTLERNIERSFVEPEMIRKVYALLCSFYNLLPGQGIGMTFDFNLQQFSEKFSLKTSDVTSCLKFLEREDYISITESFFRPSKVQIIINQKDLYKFQVEHSGLDAFIKLLLRSYEGIFSYPVPVNEKILATRSTLPVEEINTILFRLSKLEVITYIPQSDKPQLTFKQDAINGKDIIISRKNFYEFRDRAIQKMESIIHYATSMRKCRSELLLTYFGEHEQVRCGICDVCIERNKLELSDLEFKNIADQLKTHLNIQPMTLNELVHSVKEVNDEKTIKTIKWLLDYGKLQYIEDYLLDGGIRRTVFCLFAISPAPAALH